MNWLGHDTTITKTSFPRMCIWGGVLGYLVAAWLGARDWHRVPLDRE
jgi:hypothetical protein